MYVMLVFFPTSSAAQLSIGGRCSPSFRILDGYRPRGFNSGHALEKDLQGRAQVAEIPPEVVRAPSLSPSRPDRGNLGDRDPQPDRFQCRFAADLLADSFQ